jgi:hypothetical protein
VVGERDLLGEADRVVRGQHEPELAVPEALRVPAQPDVQVERRRRVLEALRMEVVLDVRDRPVPELVGRPRDLD